MDWVERDVIANGVRLHYARGGQGTPVLMLHGVTDMGHCWGRTADALAQSHDIILLDQRAHGHSEAPRHGYSVDDLAADAAGVIRALDLAPAAVVGHSLGARAGLALAATYPDLVARLVLEDPPLEVNWSSPEQPELDADQVRYQWFAWLRDLRALSRDALIARCHAESPAWSEDECAMWAESKLLVNSRLWEPGGMEIAGPWRQQLEQVACPVLLVRGEAARGAIVDQALAAETMRLSRRGEDVLISGAGHSIHRDRFASFIDAVAPFLA